MLLLAFSDKLVKHEFECYQKNIFVTFALRNEFTSRNDEEVFTMIAKHKISYNVGTCLATPVNEYCRNKYTHWKTVPCYQRYRDEQVLVKCVLASVKEFSEGTRQIFLTYGVRIRLFKNEERREETITKMIPFTPYMICFQELYIENYILKTINWKLIQNLKLLKQMSKSDI